MVEKGMGAPQRDVPGDELAAGDEVMLLGGDGTLCARRTDGPPDSTSLECLWARGRRSWAWIQAVGVQIAMISGP